VRQLFLEKNLIEIKEVCQPLLDDYSVLVDVAYSFIGSGQEFSKIITTQKYQFFQKVPTRKSDCSWQESKTFSSW